VVAEPLRLRTTTRLMNLCAGEMICAEEIKDEVGIKEVNDA
jgi:hypothetical protein